MGSIETFRDALFGNPPSPTTEPSREGALAAFTELYNESVVAIYATQAGITTVANIAARDAFYATPANQGKLVYVNNNNGVADDPLNGVYEYVSGAPRLAQAFYAALAGVVQPLVDDAEAAAVSAGLSEEAAEGAADAAEEFANDAAASAEKARVDQISAVTSFEYSSVIWPEHLKTLLPASYIARSGNDTTGTGAYAQPWKTIAKAQTPATETSTSTTIMLKSGEKHPVRGASANYGAIFGGNSSTYPRRVSNWGSAVLPPLIDARQDLSGITFTSLSGAAWEASVTLGSAPRLNGVNISDGTKLALYLDHDAEDPDPAGKSLDWITGQGSVSANDTAIIAAPGSWGVNVIGSTASDWRTTGSTAATVRIVVHLPDGSNPNGKPLKLADLAASVQFNGGEHGHLRVIGGAAKDNASTGPLGGEIPTFQSLEIIEPPCHGSVGPKNIIGLYRCHARPVEGEPAGDAEGRTTGGGGLHWFTAAPLTTKDVFCGEVDIANEAIAVYGHTSGNMGYRSGKVLRGGLIDNCASGIKFDSGKVGSGQEFFSEGFEVGAPLIMTRMGNGLQCSNMPSFKAGNADARSSYTAKGPGQALFLEVIGIASNVEITNWDINTTAINHGSPEFAIGYLLQANIDDTDWALTPRSTVTFDNCIDTSDVGKGATFYNAVGSSPRSAQVHLRLINGTTFKDLWFQTNWDQYPASLYCDDSGITMGFGGKTRQQVRDAMAALSRPCTIPDSVTMVNLAGAVVDAGL
ncbi:hypothetical protein BH11PSE6_BH11PSE6_00020 [soil metagenome]